MASNPAFNRIEQDARTGYAGFRDGTTPVAPQPYGGYQQTGPQAAYPQTGYGGPGQVGADQLREMYQAPSAGPVDTDRVSMDDVIMKTLALFALVLGLGAVGWSVAEANQQIGFMVWMGGMIGALVVGLVIAFKKTLSVPLIVAYAALEGLFLGAVSQFFETMWPGIVAQAVLATLATFAGMFLAYKAGLIKVTAKFRRIVTMMIFGYAIFAIVNFLFAMFTSTPFGFGGSGTLGILISLFAVGLAAVTLALDFDAIDVAIRTGAPRKYSWLLAHGLIVTLVWLYVEMLRLLARLRE